MCECVTKISGELEATPIFAAALITVFVAATSCFKSGVFYLQRARREQHCVLLHTHADLRIVFMEQSEINLQFENVSLSVL